MFKGLLLATLILYCTSALFFIRPLVRTKDKVSVLGVLALVSGFLVHTLTLIVGHYESTQALFYTISGIGVSLAWILVGEYMFMEYRLKMQNLVLPHVIAAAFIIGSGLVCRSMEPSIATLKDSRFIFVYITSLYLTFTSLFIATVAWSAFLRLEKQAERLTKTAKKTQKKIRRFAMTASKIAYGTLISAVIGYAILFIELKRPSLLSSFIPAACVVPLLTVGVIRKEGTEKPPLFEISKSATGLLLMSLALFKLII
ncbi:MAG: hypothetical protein JW844_05050 [Candidatus Omnitrophica bacterium]|nr:hypothetical protein [Candidatus Omnitrophota bacterium]